jgi:hypothetical protein
VIEALTESHGRGSHGEVSAGSGEGGSRW